MDPDLYFQSLIFIRILLEDGVTLMDVMDWHSAGCVSDECEWDDKLDPHMEVDDCLLNGYQPGNHSSHSNFLIYMQNEKQTSCSSPAVHLAFLFLAWMHCSDASCIKINSMRKFTYSVSKCNSCLQESCG